MNIEKKKNAGTSFAITYGIILKRGRQQLKNLRECFTLVPCCDIFNK